MAVGQVVELATPIRYEGDVTILPVLEEVEVVVIARGLSSKKSFMFDAGASRKRIEKRSHSVIKPLS